MLSKVIIRYIVPTLGLALIIWGAYKWMGGGREPSFSYVEVPEFQLYGYMYKGRPGSSTLEAQFFEVRDLSAFEEGKYLTLVSFGTGNTVDTLRQFIGTRNPDVPDHFERYSVPAGRYVEVVLDMDAMVRPSPGHIRSLASDFAGQMNLRLSDWNLEIFTGDEELKVLFPVVQN
jgi:hypothetical protein